MKKTIIEMDIFDDGLEPVTCARSFGRQEVCPQLMSERFGTVFKCRLFSTFDKNDNLEFTGGNDTGFIIPCAECLLLRKKVDKVVRKFETGPLEI